MKNKDLKELNEMIAVRISLLKELKYIDPSDDPKRFDDIVSDLKDCLLSIADFKKSVA